MRLAAATGLCFCLCLVSTRASAEEASAATTTDSLPRRPEAEAAASASYCNYVTAVADSQSAVLVSPQLFAMGGAVSGNEAPTGPTTTVVRPRVVAGASYSVSNLYRGIQTKELAAAECARYRLFNKLLAFSMAHGGGTSAPAQQAKLAVIEEALPRAEQILARAREAMGEAKITVDELDATTARIDGLRALAADTRGRLRTAAGTMQPPKETLADLNAQREQAERATEERAAKLRQAQAWDVQVKAGYDQVFGFSQTVPVFGMVTVSFNPGYFWQRPADDRAQTARSEVAKKGLEAATLRAEDTARQLREMIRAEKERLADVVTLVGELETRHQQISQVAGDRAKATADLLWLGMVPLRAELAYLRAHIADLSRTVGEAP